MVENVHGGRSSLDDEACEWVERFARGDGRRADVAALKQWMAQSAAHAGAFDRVSRIWISLEPVGEKLATKGLISPRERQPRRSSPRNAAVGRRALLGGVLAASAATAAVMMIRPPLDLWPSWSELTASFRTRPGEQRQVTLADRVSIDLNTRTSLAIESPDASEARLIAGEALISSPPQMQGPFTLLAEGGRVIAEDARFNVRLDDQGVCVTCVAGKVSVEHGRSTLSLPAGQQVRYSSTGIGQPVSVDSAAVAAWRDGIVVFESTPVADVIAEVNRYRPGKIILTNSNLGRRLFDARLRIENIGNIVRQIELVFGAHATELPGGIVLLG